MLKPITHRRFATRLFFHMNPISPAALSGYQERPNRVIGNALFFHGQIGFSGTIRAIATPDRVFRNVSGYQEHFIGVSGTTHSGYREHRIGFSGTVCSTNPLTINTDSRVFERLTL
jgi:hypothetical protein